MDECWFTGKIYTASLSSAATVATGSPFSAWRRATGRGAATPRIGRLLAGLFPPERDAREQPGLGYGSIFLRRGQRPRLSCPMILRRRCWSVTPNPDSREADAMNDLCHEPEPDGYIAAPGDDLLEQCRAMSCFPVCSDSVGATGWRLYGRTVGT